MTIIIKRQWIRGYAMLGLLCTSLSCGGAEPMDHTADEGAMTECDALGELCHPSDHASVLAHDCHELGHSGKQAECHAQFAACANECVGASEAHSRATAPSDAYCATLFGLCDAEAQGVSAECRALALVDDAVACRREFDSCVPACLAAGTAD